MSHALILGGGADQVPLIREAKNFGLNTIVVDKDLECPGRNISNFFIHESNRDVNAILIAIENMGLKDNITSVMVIGSDIPHIAQKICERLELNYWVSAEGAEIATNKLKMKNFLHENKILSAPQQIVCTYEDLLKIFKKIYFGKGDKAATGCWFKGVFLIDYKTLSDDTIFQIYNDCLRFCDGQPPLLETYIEGQQLSVEALIVKAEPQIYGYALRNYEMNTAFAPQIIENGGIQPYPGAFDRVKEVGLS